MMTEDISESQKAFDNFSQIIEKRYNLLNENDDLSDLGEEELVCVEHIRELIKVVEFLLEY